jgi:hypothetical protein
MLQQELDIALCQISAKAMRGTVGEYIKRGRRA